MLTTNTEETAPMITPAKRGMLHQSSRAYLGERGFTVSLESKHASERAKRMKLNAMLAIFDVDSDDECVDVIVERPRTRGECVGGERPCPFLTCRHHIAIDITANGGLHIVDHLDLEALRDTCSLDIADRGGHTFDQVGQVLNVTRERVRQLQTAGLEKVRALVKREGITATELPFVADRDHPPEI